MTVKKPLCYAPFINVRASSFGHAPCCVYTEPQQSKSLDEYWTSDHIKNIREQLLDGKYPSGCSLCVYNIQNQSYVQIEQFDRFYKNNPVEINVQTGNERNAPTAIEYKVSNKCNLKCRMCRPSDSNLIYEEAKKHNLEHFYNDETYPEIDTSDVVDYIVNKDIPLVYVLGGETVLDPRSIVALKKLKANNPNINLQTTTNATYYNKKFFDELKGFTNLTLVLSIDGVGKAYEYVRTNAKWEMVETVVYKILHNVDAKLIRINMVITPYNAFALKDTLLWLDKIEDVAARLGKNFSVYFSDSDDYKTRLNVLKDKHLVQIMDSLFSKDIKKLQRINDVLNILEKVQHNQNNFKTFVEFNNTLDAIRKTRLTDLDVRFEEYI